MAKPAIRSVDSASTLKKKEKTSFWSSDIFYKRLIILLVFIVYLKSIGFEFTLDDDLFYLKHQSVQQGLSGFSDFFRYGSLYKFDGTIGVQPYRPVTLLFFAIQKTIFDNSASWAHLLNVVLYLFVSLLIYSLLKKLFSGLPLAIPAFIALLFVVHPLHTEVVCSVKSADELLAALFGFGAWRLMMGNSENTQKNLLKMAGATMLFFTALLSKESAIAFLAAIPLSAYLIEKKSVRQSLMLFIPLLTVTLVFLLIRYEVIGTAKASTGIPQLENVLNAANGWAELTATKSVILFHYLRLLIVPWPLNWDYSYNQIPLVGWSSFVAWIGLLIHLLLIGLSMFFLKKRPLLSFAILFYFIASAPVNNIFFINGATLGERLMFAPSFGFSMALVYGLKMLIEKKSDQQGFATRPWFLFLASLLIVFSALSLVRAGDWKNNQSLFEKGVERSPNSSRAQYSLATEYLRQSDEEADPSFKNEQLQKAAEHFEKSLDIFPENFQAHYNAGICFGKLRDTSKTIYHYRRTIDLNPNYITAVNNLGVVYQAKKMFDSARYYYEMAYRLDPAAPLSLKNLGDLFAMKGLYELEHGNRNSAMESYKKSLSINANNPMLLNNIASMYSSEKNQDSALVYLKRGMDLDPNSIRLIENYAAVSFLAKKYEQAVLYADKALKLQPNSPKSLGVLADTYRAMGNSEIAQKYQRLYDQFRK